MSKENIAKLASIIIILAFLWNISNELGEIRKELGEIRGELGEIRGMVETNSQAIGELRADVRELRGVYVAHLAAHATQGNIVIKSDDSEAGK